MISNDSLKLLVLKKKQEKNISSFSDKSLWNTCNKYHKKSIKKFENKKLKYVDTTQIDTHKIFWELGKHYDFKKVDNKIYSILYNNGRG